LLAINGQQVRDLIDYHYYSDEDELLLEVRSADGEIWEAEIELGEGEPLGIVFAPPEPARCGNRCVFCFVHQLPKGLRKPLYVKDEDYRLSFLCGNYVTLANVTASDLARIKEQRLSPLYVSVHATAPQVRERLLGKQGLTPILPVLKELATARIMLHTQIVVCPGWNDGEVLQRTIEDLVALYPTVQSIAVVPVGLTSHRQRLPRLEPVSAVYAATFLDEWQGYAEQLSDKLGEPILFLADEWFIKADRPFPPLASYGDLPQLENGVGMIPLFLAEAAEVLAEATRQRLGRVTVVTGESPVQYLTDFCRELSRCTAVELAVVPVANRLFGPSVTVTGLVAGRDIIAALSGRDLGDAVVLPDVMLKEGEGVFLDDLAVADIAAACGVPVVVAESTPAGLYAALCNLHLESG
jgi:putative radical SAM enzyme (TIGR03279 family)